MPSSAYSNTAFVMDFLAKLEPKSILDVGAGFGRWGFLCRCHLGGGYNLQSKPDQELRIDAIEIFSRNISSIYSAVYNNTFNEDARKAVRSCGKYDVIICGDMIEHLEKGEAWDLVGEMRSHASQAMIVIVPFGDCPQGIVDGNDCEIHRSTWSRKDFKDCDVLIETFPYSDNVQVGVIIWPLCGHARWLVKTMQSQLRSYLAGKFPSAMRTARKCLSKFMHVPDLSGRRNALEGIFTGIYNENNWRAVETVSGPGSTLANTVAIRKALPDLVRDFGIKSVLDIPCGDFNWMKEEDLRGCKYIGADIVENIISANTEKYSLGGSGQRSFLKMDITKDRLPEVDLILCRDGLVHLSTEDALKAVRNMKESCSRYMLVTTFPETKQNTDITAGQWRALNMQIAPFMFPPPLRLINEEYHEYGSIYSDKSIGLWCLKEIPA